VPAAVAAVAVASPSPPSTPGARGLLEAFRVFRLFGVGDDGKSFVRRAIRSRDIRKRSDAVKGDGLNRGGGQGQGWGQRFVFNSLLNAYACLLEY
jgi:hypothetical protein